MTLPARLMDALMDLQREIAAAQITVNAAYESVLCDVCSFAGVRYGGVQEHQGMRWLVITEPDTGSTGYVPIDESFTTSAVVAKCQEIRRQYGLTG